MTGGVVVEESTTIAPNSLVGFACGGPPGNPGRPVIKVVLSTAERQRVARLASKALRDRFSAEIIDALRRSHPRALA